jgi:hypothetical protein
MKYSLLPAFALASISCATAPPPVISVQQARAFDDVVHQAEAAGVTEDSSKAGALLRDAKSDFYYAEHLPSDPDRARDIAYRALAKAQTALGLARSSPQPDIALGGATDGRPSTVAPAAPADSTLAGAPLVAAPATPAPGGN